MKIVRTGAVVVQKIMHRVHQWPSKIVHQIYCLDYIRKTRERSRADLIQSHGRYRSNLEDDEFFLGYDLIDKGFCSTKYDIFESFQNQDFFSSANTIYDFMEDHYVKTGKTIDIIKSLSANPSLLEHFTTVFRAGLDAELLRVVEHYLRLPVAYGGVDFFFTIADGSERGARTWHKDSEDNPMIKVAVYLNDVGDDDGPFEILHLQQNDPQSQKFRGFFQQDLIDLQNEDKIKFDITSFTGPLGTVILCDTFKYFHRGKPARGRNRRALFFNYYAEKPLTPYFCPNPPFSTLKMKELVADLSPKQKDAALWREKLVGVDRIVTKRRPYFSI